MYFYLIFLIHYYLCLKASLKIFVVYHHQQFLVFLLFFHNLVLSQKLIVQIMKWHFLIIQKNV